MKGSSLPTALGTVNIQAVQPADFLPLSSIYQSIFTKHNIFQKPRKEVLKYLRETQKKNAAVGGGYLVAQPGQKVVGGILVKKESQDTAGKHSVWKFNHLAVLPEYSGQGIGTALMQAAEQKVRKALKSNSTAKIELHVSETEKSLLEFYRRFGFTVEGTLASHYRYGERVYVLGKEITG